MGMDTSINLVCVFKPVNTDRIISRKEFIECLKSVGKEIEIEYTDYWDGVDRDEENDSIAYIFVRYNSNDYYANYFTDECNTYEHYSFTLSGKPGEFVIHTRLEENEDGFVNIIYLDEYTNEVMYGLCPDILLFLTTRFKKNYTYSINLLAGYG